MNKVILVGRLVFEPEAKQSQNGVTTLNTRMAVSRNDKDKTTDFINIHAFGTTAEFISKYFRKGDPISVSGKLQTSTWEKQDGTKVNETYVLVNEVAFVPSKKDEGQSQAPNPPKQAPKSLPFEL